MVDNGQMNETKKDELTKKAEEIVSKWKSEMEQQNMTTDPYKFYRLNCISMHEDMEEFWDLYLILSLKEMLRKI